MSKAATTAQLAMTAAQHPWYNDEDHQETLSRARRIASDIIRNQRTGAGPWPVYDHDGRFVGWDDGSTPVAGWVTSNLAWAISSTPAAVRRVDLDAVTDEVYRQISPQRRRWESLAVELDHLIAEGHVQDGDAAARQAAVRRLYDSGYTDSDLRYEAAGTSVARV